VHLESAGKCELAVVVTHIAEYLDVCGHLESSSVDSAWEALSQRLPKLSPVSTSSRTCVLVAGETAAMSGPKGRSARC
jgi:hypothetical protein